LDEKIHRVFIKNQLKTTKYLLKRNGEGVKIKMMKETIIQSFKKTLSGYFEKKFNLSLKKKYYL